MPVEPRFDPVIHEPMRLRICGILSAADCGVVTTRRRHAPPPASGRMSTPHRQQFGIRRSSSRPARRPTLILLRKIPGLPYSS